MLEVQRLARLPDVARLESAPRLSVGLTAPLSTQVPAAQGAVPRLASPPLRGRPSSGGPMRTHERTSQLALDAKRPPVYMAAAPSRLSSSRPFQGLTDHSGYLPRASPPLHFTMPPAYSNRMWSQMVLLPLSPLPPLPPLPPPPLPPPQQPPLPQLPPPQQPQLPQQPQQPQMPQLRPPQGSHGSILTPHAADPVDGNDDADGLGGGPGRDQPLQLSSSSSTINLARDENDEEAAEFLLSLSPAIGAHALSAKALSASVSLLNTPDLSVFYSPRYNDPLLGSSSPLPNLAYGDALPSPLGLGARYESGASSATSSSLDHSPTPTTQQVMASAPPRAQGWGASERTRR